jgi:hypothetical protein
MSDQNVTYEEVPSGELQAHDRYHTNKHKTEDIDPLQGGVVAETLGIPIIGKKVVGDTLKSNLVQAVMDKLKPSQASVTVSGAPTGEGAITPQGGGGWNQTLAGNTAPGSQMNKKWLDINQRMAETVGPGGDLAGGSIYKGSVLLPPGANTPAPSAPEVSAPTPTTLSPYERALQAVKGFGADNPIAQGARAIANSPYTKALGTAAGLFGAGEDAVRMYNHWKGDQLGRQVLDALGVASNIATVAPTPFSPESNIAGALASVPIDWYQRRLEAEENKKANGGLLSLD